MKHLAEKPPYQVGDILYVRETWKHYEKAVGCGEQFHVKQHLAYKADEENWEVQKPSEWYEGKWRPAIHMPKNAARLWLKVTDVRLERLQDITEDGAEKEGCVNTHEFIRDPESEYNVPPHTANEQFVDVWNRTVPKEKQVDLAWEANPWVWVIQFERCEKPDESSDHRTPPQAI